MDLFLLGAIAMGCAVAGLLFLRFWRNSGDRFFFFFALSFFIESANRAIFAIGGARQEEGGLYYLIRLGSYAMILCAIIAKNRPRQPR